MENQIWGWVEWRINWHRVECIGILYRWSPASIGEQVAKKDRAPIPSKTHKHSDVSAQYVQLLVVITCSKKAPERVRASTSEYSPIIPQKSITTNAQTRILLCWPSFSFLCESGELRNWWMKLFTGGLLTLRARLVSTKPHVSGWSVVWRGANDRIRLLQEMETRLSITAPY